MEKTSYSGNRATELGESDQNKGLPQPPLELPYGKTATVIDLPSPEDIIVDAVDLRTAIEKRRSVRNYSEQPLTLKELSWLLWCTQGVQKLLKQPAKNAPGSERRTLRPVPSSAAKHPLETYLLVNRVEGLRPGLYRFMAIVHKLMEINLEEGIAEKINNTFMSESRGARAVERCAVLFIWTFVPYRMCWRYAHRGPRALMEVGHVAQNLHLSAEAVRCGVCVVDPFRDREINDILGLDIEEQFVIYAATVGKKK